MLHQIGEEHRIVGYDQEASTSHGPSIRPPVSSTPIRMQPIRVEGEGELIDEVVVEMVDKVMVEMVREVVVHLSRHCLLRYPPYLPITRDFYTPTNLHITFHTPNTYTSLPYPVSQEPASIAVDITLSSYLLSSPTLLPSMTPSLTLYQSWVHF